MTNMINITLMTIQSKTNNFVKFQKSVGRRKMSYYKYDKY